MSTLPRLVSLALACSLIGAVAAAPPANTNTPTSQTSATSPAKRLADLKQRAEQHDIAATLELAKAYETKEQAQALGLEVDRTEARQWWLKAANLGSAEAQYELASWTDNSTEQEKWYSLAAAQGHKEAQTGLAEFYYSETSDRTSALYWYEQAAQQGVAEAHFALAKFYLNGEGVKQDCAKTIDHLTQAQTTRSKSVLYLMYHSGECVAPDAAKAQEWLDKLGSEGSDYRDFAGLYGDSYDYFFTPNQTKAWDWMVKAAEAGDADAQLVVGEGYFKEPLNEYTKLDFDHLPQDKAKGIEWFTKAAQQGNEQAQFRLFLSYSAGNGVQADPKAAAKWQAVLEKAKFDDIQPYALADYYLKGKGLKTDYPKALELLTQAAQQDDEYRSAALKLYSLYQYGDESIRDPAKAQQWLDTYLNNDTEGKRHYALAKKFEGYSELPEDEKLYLQWLIKAARLGSKEAQLDLVDKPEALTQGITRQQQFDWLSAIAEENPKEYATRRAHLALANSYYSGQWSTVDKPKSLALYLKLAEQDTFDAKVKAFFMYNEGDGVPQDSIAAEALLKDQEIDDYSFSAYAIYRYYAGEAKLEPFQLTNPTKAREWLLKAANQGNYRAITALIEEYQTSDKAQSLQWMSKLVTTNKDAIQYAAKLYLSYREGLGVPANAAEAERWLKLINEQNPPTQANLYFELARQYQALKPDVLGLRQAISWYEQAHTLGNANVSEKLAEIYSNDAGLPDNLTQALKWTAESAQRGNEDSIAQAYFMYRHGIGAAVDPEQAARYLQQIDQHNLYSKVARLYEGEKFGVKADPLPWLLRAVEHAPNDIDSAMELADHYYEEKQYPAALEHYQRTLQLEHDDNDLYELHTAQFILGSLYTLGQGVTQNYEQALHYLTPAAQGNNFEALSYLYLMYEHGIGVQADTQAAQVWLEKAQSDTDSYPYTLYQIADLYYEGNLVKQDYAKALQWYKTSLEQGYTAASYDIGWMYDNGEGVKEDNQHALDYYLKAARDDSTRAQTKLGGLYYNGELGKADYVQALAWYTKAAAQDDDYAQYLLGWMYDHGQGTTQDTQQALDWYTKSARNDYLDAQYELLTLLAEPEQQEELKYWLKRTAANEPSTIKKMRLLNKLNALTPTT